MVKAWAASAAVLSVVEVVGMTGCSRHASDGEGALFVPSSQSTLLVPTATAIVDGTTSTSTTTNPLAGVVCGNDMYTAERAEARPIFDAIVSAGAQDACSRVKANTTLLGEGTIAECEEMVRRAAAIGDFGAVLPDEELRSLLVRYLLSRRVLPTDACQHKTTR
jgi:hypothetical protein